MINHVSKELAGFRMLRGGDPVFHDLLKFGRGHAGVSGHGDFDQRMVATSKCCMQISLEQRGERLRCVPLGALRRERLDAVKHKIQLHRHWLLAPWSAVVVEGCDALGDGNEVRRAGFTDLLDKGDDGLFRRAVNSRR
jgi:hypothetical protein